MVPTYCWTFIFICITCPCRSFLCWLCWQDSTLDQIKVLLQAAVICLSVVSRLLFYRQCLGCCRWLCSVVSFHGFLKHPQQRVRVWYCAEVPLRNCSLTHKTLVVQPYWKQNMKCGTITVCSQIKSALQICTVNKLFDRCHKWSSEL